MHAPHTSNSGKIWGVEKNSTTEWHKNPKKKQQTKNKSFHMGIIPVKSVAHAYKIIVHPELSHPVVERPWHLLVYARTIPDRLHWNIRHPIADLLA